MKKPVLFQRPIRMTPKAHKVLEIMQRDGGITHLTAMHYGIGSITKEVARIRAACPMNALIHTVKRVDADGHKYTRWTLKHF